MCTVLEMGILLWVQTSVEPLRFLHRGIAIAILYSPPKPFYPAWKKSNLCLLHPQRLKNPKEAWHKQTTLLILFPAAKSSSIYFHLCFWLSNCRFFLKRCLQTDFAFFHGLSAEYPEGLPLQRGTAFCRPDGQMCVRMARLKQRFCCDVRANCIYF